MSEMPMSLLLAVLALASSGVDPELEALQRQIAEKLGYRLVDHRMELYGVALSRDD